MRHVDHIDILGQSLPDRGSSICKGPEYHELHIFEEEQVMLFACLCLKVAGFHLRSCCRKSKSSIPGIPLKLVRCLY